MPQPFQYGGQAVIEGVMMRGPKNVAIAVRKANGEIVVDNQHVSSLAQRFFLFRLPLLRGCLALVETMALGIKALTYSANQAGEGEEEQLSSMEMVVTVVVALVLAVFLFVVVPTAVAHFTGSYLNPFWQNLGEGLLRIVIFLVYVISIGRIGDIQRVFQYHGAEHKVVYTHEAGEELTLENARRFPNLHPRCGTAFLLVVMVLTIFFFSFMTTSNLWWRIGSRVVVLPIVAGLAYEIIKLSGRYHKTPWVRTIIAPGLWLQKLTTREPDNDQIEVALHALKSVLAMEAPNNNPTTSQTVVAGSDPLHAQLP
ncbi:MAG: DUF1385 domain-containing protein [Bacillota bacterium]